MIKKLLPGVNITIYWGRFDKSSDRYPQEQNVSIAYTDNRWIKRQGCSLGQNFDEIQEIENWERALNSFRVEMDCDIYMTGSNAKLLSGELSTYLAELYVEFIIYMFLFTEFKKGYYSKEQYQGYQHAWNE